MILFKELSMSTTPALDTDENKSMDILSVFIIA